MKKDTARPETTEVTVGVNATEAATATDTPTEKEVAEATGTEKDMAAPAVEEMMIMGLDQAATTAVMNVGGVMTTSALPVGIETMDRLEENVAEEEGVVVAAEIGRAHV